MDPLAEALAWRTVVFVEAAERASWPLPLSGPAHTLTRRTAKSTALNPADFGLRADALFDATGLIAYGIDLRASMESFEEGADADEDQILISLEIAYEVFSSEFGTPYMCAGLEEGTGYYWWQRPSGLRMHLCFTAEATSELWVARPAEIGTPQATPASTVWDHIDALVATNWTESQLSLLQLARARGWTALSDSYECFYLNRGAGDAAWLAESHPRGVPDYAVICAPPEVWVSANPPAAGRVTTTFAAVTQPEALIAQVRSRYGAGRSEETGSETKHTWQVDQYKTLTVTLRGIEVTVDVHVSAYGMTRRVPVQEFAAESLALIAHLTEAPTAPTAADIAHLAQSRDWVRMGPESTTEDVFFTRQSVEGKPGVVVGYRNGLVKHVFLQALPLGLTTAHRNDVHASLVWLLGQLGREFEPVGKQTPPVTFSAERYRGRAVPRELGRYRFTAKNGSALVTVVPSFHEVRVEVSYPLTNISPTFTAPESGPITAEGKTPPGFKALVFVLGVLTVTLIAALLT